MKTARRVPSFPRMRESIFAARTLDSGPASRTGQALRRNDGQEASRHPRSEPVPYLMRGENPSSPVPMDSRFRGSDERKRE